MADHRGLRREEFNDVHLDDLRLDHRLGLMAQAVAENPKGLVSQVFAEPKARQGAYDFLANPAVRPGALLEGAAAATCRRCEDHDFIYVPIDGSSVTLTDRAQTKPLGSIGARRLPSRGLKVVDAIAITPDGTVQGLLDLQVWARKDPASKSRHERRRDGDSETQYWRASVASVLDVLDANTPNLRPWFVMDREADQAQLLRELVQAGALFTIRANQDRVVEHGGRRAKLFSRMRRSKPFGRQVIEIPRSHERPARRAVLELRAGRVTLLLPTYEGRQRTPVEVGMVELREVGCRRDRLHWRLLTSHPISTREDVQRVIASYKMRWRIEEFHRTWKSGGCGVEDIQLRTADGIRKWAILLAAMAARIERLKHLARTQPDAPATVDLTTDEIDALVALKRRNGRPIPDVLTIKEAVVWIGELGGYAGHYKGYDPGSKTLALGLAQLAIRADAWACAREALRNEPKKR
jgi:hypothetical protein